MSSCSFRVGRNKHLQLLQHLNRIIRHRTAANVRVLIYQDQSTSKLNCNSLVFYPVPKAFCSAAAVTDTVHCSSILSHGCRTGHFGCRRQSDRRRRSQCSILPGHSLLSLIDRRCRSLSAAEWRQTQMVMYRLLKCVHSQITGQTAQPDSV